MPPPPAEPFASRIFLGPALRTQPDRRLVKLVREGYEAAFEEIVRRYRRPLDRFAAAFVGNRSEDVTQDAFSKALLALRGSEKEIELRPWLYRIVRNTALNDLRDQPRPIEELGEAAGGGESAAVEAERREEIRELMERLRALPEPQRAAIVMRELEGLSHEEIAAALGVSGGAARQAIHRARVTLRNGLGMLVPLPLLRMLFDHGAEVAGAGAGGAVAAAGAASAGGGGAALGGLGAGGALKVGVATALLAGSVGAGVAMQPDRGRDAVPEPAAAEASVLRNGANGTLGSPGGRAGQGPQLSSSANRGRGSDDGDGRVRGDDGHEHGNDGHHGRGGEEDNDGLDDSSRDSGGPGPSDQSGHGGRGPGRRHSGEEGFDEDHSGEGISGGSHSGRHGSGGGSDSGSSGNGHGGGGSGRDGGSGGSGGGGDDGLDGGQAGSGSGRSGGSDGGGSDSGGRGPAPATTPPPTLEPSPDDLGDRSGGSSSGDDGSGSGRSGSGGGDDDS